MKFSKGYCSKCFESSSPKRHEFLRKWVGSADTGYDLEVYKVYYECKCGNKFNYKVSKRVDI